MARYDFGGTLADFVVTPRHLGGLDVLGLSAATLTFWSAQAGGTRYTDLQLNGSAVSSISVGTDGQVPTFQGPDTITAMWADGGAGRVRIVSQGIPGPAGPGATNADIAGYVGTGATKTALDAAYTQLTSIATTATASATLAAGRHTPVDATSGARTMTLPTAPVGALLSVEKTDASTNAVNVTGTLRGVASSTIPLTAQYDARTFLSEGSGSWRPVSDHRTASSLTAQIQDVDHTITAPQRFKVGIPHIDPTAWGVPFDGTTNAAPALQNMIDTGMTGAVVRFPPSGRMRISSTLKAPATKYGIHWEAAGGRSFNEADSGIPGAAFIGDAGVTILQIGNDAPTSVQYRAPRLVGLTFREAGDAQTATLLDLRGLVNWTLRDLNFRGAAVAIKADSFGFDASWGVIDHPMLYKCKRGVHALGADFEAHGGNYAVQEWAFYLEPKGSVHSTAKLFGVKIDGTGPGGGVYSEGSFLQAHGVEMEFGTTDGQYGYKFVRDAVKHADSGRANNIFGGSVTGTNGTGHIGVDIGAGCTKTVILGTEVVNVTTKLNNAGTLTTAAFAGDTTFTDRGVGTAHYQLQDGSATPLVDFLADAATSAMMQLRKSTAKFRIKLGGTTFNDEFAIQNSAGTNLHRFQGDGGSVLGTSGGTQTVNGVLKHAGSTVGFNNATPVGKAANPGTATGTDAAVLNAVVTALRNLGLVT